MPFFSSQAGMVYGYGYDSCRVLRKYGCRDFYEGASQIRTAFSLIKGRTRDGNTDTCFQSTFPSPRKSRNKEIIADDYKSIIAAKLG